MYLQAEWIIKPDPFGPAERIQGFTQKFRTNL